MFRYATAVDGGVVGGVVLTSIKRCQHLLNNWVERIDTRITYHLEVYDEERGVLLSRVRDTSNE